MNNIVSISKNTKTPISVIVVDDDPKIAKNLRDLLGLQHQSDRIEITSVIDPRQALEAIKEVRPDLVLLDYKMPWIDGLQVLQEINNLPSVLRPPVIFLTAFSEYRAEALRAGARDYLDKGDITMNAVLARVEYVINNGERADTPQLVLQRFSEEIERSTSFIRELTEAPPAQIVDCQWYWVGEEGLYEFDWVGAQPNRMVKDFDKRFVSALLRSEQPIVWMENDADCTESVSTYPTDRRPTEQYSMWLRISTSSRGYGLWLAYFLGSRLDELKKDELSDLLPQLVERCSESLEGFYRIQKERLRSMEILKAASKDLSDLRLYLAASGNVSKEHVIESVDAALSRVEKEIEKFLMG